MVVWLTGRVARDRILELKPFHSSFSFAWPLLHEIHPVDVQLLHSLHRCSISPSPFPSHHPSSTLHMPIIPDRCDTYICMHAHEMEVIMMEQPSTVERLLNWSVEPLMQRCEDERMEKEGIHSTPEGRNVHVGHAGVLHDTFSSSSFPSVTVYAVSIASHRIASHRIASHRIAFTLCWQNKIHMYTVVWLACSSRHPPSIDLTWKTKLENSSRLSKTSCSNGQALKDGGMSAVT